ncbi:MAG: TlpA family protein disulfide reductase [Proteobacteria bacterium]|nr:TlpA family protein disulfide reductase [Pseudomonadota bacterium]
MRQGDCLTLLHLCLIASTCNPFELEKLTPRLLPPPRVVKPAKKQTDNTWPQAASFPEGLEGTGRNKGDVAYDFTLKDQFGDKVQLYQFYGSVIVLDIFTGWCEPCQDAAPDNQKGYEKYKDDGLVVIGLMQESASGAANVQAAKNWTDTYGLTHPVLADPSYTQDDYAVLGYPTVVVIDREMKVVEPDLWPVSFSKIESYL